MSTSQLPPTSYRPSIIRSLLPWKDGPSVPPTLRLTDLPPGATSRAAIGAVVCGLIGFAILGVAAVSGLDNEVPSFLPNGTLALRLTAHRGLLALSAVSTLIALVCAVAGFARSRALASAGLALVAAWIGLIGWALLG